MITPFLYAQFEYEDPSSTCTCFNSQAHEIVSIVVLADLRSAADTMRQCQMQGMWNNPAFLQQMSSLMSNPAIVDQIIASNPQLAGMAPQVRQVFQSEQFRQMMYVPCASPPSMPHSPTHPFPGRTRRAYA